MIRTTVNSRFRPPRAGGVFYRNGREEVSRRAGHDPRSTRRGRGISGHHRVLRRAEKTPGRKAEHGVAPRGRAPGEPRRHGEAPAASCADGERVETVLIPDEERLTQCISTQAGCAMGCRLLPDGRAGGSHAQPRGGRRSSTQVARRREPPAGSAGVDQPGLHGDGRAARSTSTALVRGLLDPRSPTTGSTSRPAPRHRLHRGMVDAMRVAAAPRCRRCARGLAQRHHRRAARPDHAGEPEVPARGADRGAEELAAAAARARSRSSTCCWAASTTRRRTPGGWRAALRDCGARSTSSLQPARGEPLQGPRARGGGAVPDVPAGEVFHDRFAQEPGRTSWRHAGSCAPKNS